MKTLRFLLSVTSSLLPRPAVPSSFLFPSSRFLAEGDLLRGNAPSSPLPHALDLKCRRTAIGIMQKTWNERGSCKSCDAYSRLLFLTEETTSRGKIIAFRAAGTRLCFALNRDGHIWLLATAVTARLPTVGAIGVLPYLDGAVHRVQSLLRQLFQGT